MTKMTTETFDQFKTAFAAICLRFGGAFNHTDTIGQGAAYRIHTAWGTLRVSIHEAYSSRFHIQSIFLSWRDYTGPVPFPVAGDFNHFSHKWNITVSGVSMAEAQCIALGRLEHRLAAVPLAVMPKGNTLPIADIYADLLSAVNRGDIAGAKSLAAQIAA